MRLELVDRNVPFILVTIADTSVIGSAVVYLSLIRRSSMRLSDRSQLTTAIVLRQCSAQIILKDFNVARELSPLKESVTAPLPTLLLPYALA